MAVFRAFAPVVRVLDADTGGSVRTYSPPAGVCAVAWHPLGTLLAAACDDALIYVWSAETGQHETVLRGHQSVVTDIAFHPAGDLVITSSWDGTTRLWDLAMRRQVPATSGQFRQFSRDGRRLASWKYDVLGLWSVATPEHRACSDVLPEGKADLGR